MHENKKWLILQVKYKTIKSFNSEKQWCVHGEKAVRIGEWTKYAKTSDITFVFQLSTAFLDEANTAHVGSEYHIYICPDMLTATAAQWSICKCIYHEMSHKVLGTYDTTVDGKKVYGELACQKLAQKSREQTLQIADCWAFFFMEFYNPKYFWGLI